VKSTIKKFKFPAYFTERSVTPALLFLCFITYGIYIFWMGFYWDDWPWMYFSHILGPESLLTIDSEHRPLSGFLLWLGAELLGETPLYWQMLVLIFRWFTGLAMWWAMTKVWPQRVEKSTWIAFLFLVFPGFTQQFVSVNSSRHILSLAFFCLSLGLMVAALRQPKRYWQLTFGSLALALIGMLMSEYYYGLELIRPVVLWLVIDTRGKTRGGCLKALFRYWAPYLLMVSVIFLWRYGVSKNVNYQVSIIESLQANPFDAIFKYSTTILQNFYEVTVKAWFKLLLFPSTHLFGLKKTLFYWGLVLLSSSLTFVYLYKFRRDPDDKRWAKEAVMLGLCSLLVSGLPFLVTGLELKLTFPGDRGTLPMIFGVSVLFVGLLDLLLRPRIAKVLLISAVIGLAVGTHFQIAVSFQRDWDYQSSFFRQLAWRIPGMMQGSSLLTQELPIVYSTDNSLAAPLNWIYAADTFERTMPYDIFYLDLRLGSLVPELKQGMKISHDYRLLSFEGSVDNAIVIYHQPPGCLRVLHPIYDAHYPKLPELIAAALPFSNLNRIVAKPDKEASLPTHIYGTTPRPDWCYYFEKADLARQQGDWQQVVALGDVAFQLDDSPNHASERVPFIQGYAYAGQWDRAVDLTLETIEINKFMQPMVCSVWADILKNSEPSENQENAILRIKVSTNCPDF
jgi:hypothetical protein